jgi:cytochrome b6-f complex iron-sulfur subunit
MPSGDGGAGCGGNAIGVGNASGVAVNSAVLHMTPTTNIFICHDGAGLYAVDAGCTHLGCDVVLKSASDLSQGFTCPCHHANYDANGENPTAPAPRPLPHYQLCVQPSGALVVDPTTTVSASARLKL